MLVSNSSPVKQLPVTMPVRQILFIDGVRYSVETIDLVYGRLVKALDTIAELAEGSGDLSRNISEAMSDAWAFVDYIYRLNRLVENMPGLKKKLPEVQMFLRNTAKAEGFRNFVQHIPSEINEFVRKRAPLWGTLSWVGADITKSFTLVPGTFFGGATVTGNIYDTHENKFIERLVLDVGGDRIDLADMYDRTETFWNWFEVLCVDNLPSGDQHGSDVKMTFSIGPAKGTT